MGETLLKISNFFIEKLNEETGLNISISPGEFALIDAHIACGHNTFNFGLTFEISKAWESRTHGLIVVVVVYGHHLKFSDPHVGKSV